MKNGNKLHKVKIRYMNKNYTCTSTEGTAVKRFLVVIQIMVKHWGQFLGHTVHAAIHNKNAIKLSYIRKIIYCFYQRQMWFMIWDVNLMVQYFYVCQ